MRIFRNIICSTALTLISFIKVQAQDKIHLNLTQIMDSIESSYPDLQKYAERINAINAKASGARSQMAPQLSAGINRFPYNTSVLKEKDSPMNQAGIMIGGEQMFTNPSKLNRKRDYYLSLTDIEEKNASWTKNQLNTQAKVFYYRRLIAEKKLLVIRDNEKTLTVLINTAKQKYSVNQTDLSTIFKAEAKFSELSNMRAMLNSQIAESNIGLVALMNKPSGFSFIIDTTIILQSNFSDLSDTSLIHRSDLQSVDGSIRSMRLNLSYMSSLKRPDFGVRAEHMQMFGMPSQYTIMGMITVPIAPWSSGMYKSEVKSMQFEINAMQKEKETMLLMARKMLNEKRSMFRYEHEQLMNYEKLIIPAYQKNFDTGLLSYGQNTGNLFILLDAWEMLVMKRMDYWDKYLDLLLLQAEIDYELERK